MDDSQRWSQSCDYVLTRKELESMGVSKKRFPHKDALNMALSALHDTVDVHDSHADMNAYHWAVAEMEYAIKLFSENYEPEWACGGPLSGYHSGQAFRAVKPQESDAQ